MGQLPKGSYLRVRIEMDLTRPLARGRTISAQGRSMWIPFRYEKFPFLCFSCGRIIHGSYGCLEKKDLREESSEREDQFGAWLRGNSVGKKRSSPRFSGDIRRVGSWRIEVGEEAESCHKGGNEGLRENEMMVQLVSQATVGVEKQMSEGVEENGGDSVLKETDEENGVERLGSDVPYSEVVSKGELRVEKEEVLRDLVKSGKTWKRRTWAMGNKVDLLIQSLSTKRPCEGDLFGNVEMKKKRKKNQKRRVGSSSTRRIGGGC